MHPALRTSRHALTLLAVALVLAGCRREPPRGFVLAAEVGAGRFAVGDGDDVDGLRFVDAPRPAEITVDGERRPAVLTSAAGWSWRGRVPEGARLSVGVQAYPAAWRQATSLRAEVAVRDGDRREVLKILKATRREPLRWLDAGVDLGRFAGREVTLEVTARLVGLTDDDARVVAWGPVAVSAPGAPEVTAERKRPNVLFILVDTLRHDRLTPYGYERDTTPEMQRWLAQAGAVVEDAYAQAPWTLPSVISFMTGRQPGELVGADMATFALPDGVPTLAERLAKLGYETGGFYANPTLHAGIGFARGFRTFYTAPPTLESMRLDASDVNGRAMAWLAAHQDGERPFFLYVHYIDPHDPYLAPDLVDGRSPFYPEYRGPVLGGWVHGFYTGRLQLRGPEDVAHLSALYDSEVRWVDQAIGRLLATLSPETLAETLIVLTSDHGEELYDHGGWKHGQTLYEEQIHVPLLVRWDGRIRPGTRLAGTVSLLDLAPTIVAAAVGAADPAQDGIDLLPALTGEAPLPRRAAQARHLASGPLRAAAVLDGRKLVLFDREARFTPADELQAHLYAVDMERLARAELYDLAADPAERRNLAGERPAEVGRLAPAIAAQLDLELPGLRVTAGDVPPGSRLGGTIRFERPPAEWISLFLAAEDRVAQDGVALRFDLTAETFEKGFLVRGDVGSLAEISLTLDGVPLPPQRIALGDGKPYRGGRVLPEELLAAGRPRADAAVRLWIHDGAAAEVPARAADPETERRLRALGYIK